MATVTAKGYRDVSKPSDPEAHANVQVYNDLMLSCQEDIIFGFVDESVSETFPDGDARVAWKNLEEKYEPNPGVAKVQLKQAFHQLKPGSVEDDPDVWITQLELKCRRLKTLGAVIEDDDLVLHILNHLPREYETVVELCKEDLSRGKSDLTTVKERIMARFTRLQKAKEDQDEAVALMVRSQFKGACTVCSKIGHKGVDCFTLGKNKAKKEAFYKKVNENRYKNNNTTTTTTKIKRESGGPTTEALRTGMQDRTILQGQSTTKKWCWSRTTGRSLTQTLGLPTQVPALISATVWKGCLTWKTPTSLFWSVMAGVCLRLRLESFGDTLSIRKVIRQLLY